MAGFDIGGALDKVLTAGVDIWADSEKARNYSAGAQTVATRDAAGNAIPVGTNGGMAAVNLQNPLVVGGLVLIGVILLAAVLRR